MKVKNKDTNGAEEREGVPSFQRLKCMQEWYLGWEKVSCLERCPQFRVCDRRVICCATERLIHILHTPSLSLSIAAH